MGGALIRIVGGWVWIFPGLRFRRPRLFSASGVPLGGGSGYFLA